jgi:hypothetical protein
MVDARLVQPRGDRLTRFAEADEGDEGLHMWHCEDSLYVCTRMMAGRASALQYVNFDSPSLGFKYQVRSLG